MNIQKATSIYGAAMSIIYVALAAMFLLLEQNPFKLQVPYNYVLGGLLLLYGLFRGYKAITGLKSGK